MAKMLLLVLSIVISTAVCSNKNLPPCPPFVQYQPKDMPLNCVLPSPSMMPFPPGLPAPIPGNYPFFPPMFPPPMINMTLSNDNKLARSISKLKYPIPHPMPMFPGGNMPLPPGMPMMPMPMPIISPPNGPIIVMPYYSRKSPKKSNNHHKDPPPEVTEKAEECLDDAAAQNKIKRKRHLVVTPVLSYVTKEGYIIYKKVLSDVEALRWLKREIKKLKHKKNAEKKAEEEENDNQENGTEKVARSEEVKKSEEGAETDANKENEEENQTDSGRRFFAAAEISDSEITFSRNLKRKIEKNLRHKERLFQD